MEMDCRFKVAISELKAPSHSHTTLFNKPYLIE
jgi:hypothetical protein